MNKIKIALLVFVLVSVLDIIGIVFSIPILVLIFKPFILLSLIVLYRFSVSIKNRGYILALIFSFLGDVFLIFNGEFYFIAGLLSFLISHILFIKI
ncbi:MAG: lysoplasmalogenase, partial [Lutibacter sp.]|nr:lysoplasmalogenase [Lutibacter sp.]